MTSAAPQGPRVLRGGPLRPRCTIHKLELMVYQTSSWYRNQMVVSIVMGVPRKKNHPFGKLGFPLMNQPFLGYPHDCGNPHMDAGADVEPPEPSGAFFSSAVRQARKGRPRALRMASAATCGSGPGRNRRDEEKKTCSEGETAKKNVLRWL